MRMQDLRCVGRSRLPGTRPSCGQLLCRVAGDAQVEVKCPRCKKLNEFSVGAMALAFVST